MNSEPNRWVYEEASIKRGWYKVYPHLVDQLKAELILRGCNVSTTEDSEITMYISPLANAYVLAYYQDTHRALLKAGRYKELVNGQQT